MAADSGWLVVKRVGCCFKVILWTIDRQSPNYPILLPRRNHGHSQLLPECKPTLKVQILNKNFSHSFSLERVRRHGHLVQSRVRWKEESLVTYHCGEQTHLTLGGDRSVPALQATSIWKAKWWKLWELSPPSCSAVALVAEHTKDTSAPRRTSG